MDPQQKQLLQCVYRALEDAGVPMEDASGTRTGVFFGKVTCQKDQILCGPNDIILIWFLLYCHRDKIKGNNSFYYFTVEIYGISAGLMNRDYETNAAHMHPSVINHWTGTGLAMSIAANRVSYIFNFTGPSLSIDCACSSSLVALHLACQSIKQGPNMKNKMG